MGFGLITNASENLRNPQKNVPRAIWLSILIVMVLYMGIAAVTLGNLSLPNVACVGGSWLAPPHLIEQQNWDERHVPFSAFHL